jgi:uncharacterized protein YecE (DUF72 family)
VSGLQNPPLGDVRYGTAGWSFADWYGTFYPVAERDEGPGSLFTGVLQAPDPDVGLAKRQPLRYYARYFDTVEVNSSFYGIPRVSTVENWARQTDSVGDRPFLFSLKLPMPMSHEGVLDAREVRAFLDCLQPLEDRGRLAGVLAQFPQRFPWSDASCQRLERIRETFSALPLIVEVRHESWARPEGWAFLAERELSLANIDQPQGRSTLPPTLEVTRPALAYVRLHGRNAQAWFDPQAGRDNKYDYLYGAGELDEWSGRIKALASLADRTLVIANNHYRGKAPANALELRSLGGEAVEVPRRLEQTYARLGRLGA